MKEKILTIITEKRKENIIPKTISVEKRTIKLYLNTLINKLYNNPKSKIIRFKNSVVSKIVKWWRTDTTQDALDIIKFVAIHGLLGAPVILAMLTIANANIGVVQTIKSSTPLTALLFFIAAGAGYYLLFDINKEIFDTWGHRKIKK